jgi:hypothetical protein
VVVYLDQWCFAGKFVRDRTGTLNEADAGCYEFLRSLALDGSVIFPLSQAHYRETWKRDNADGRWDTAVVMGELSGFHTFNFSGLAEWEALKAVAQYTDSPHQVAEPTPLGWGMAHCLSGHEGSLYVIDKRTGKPARWGTLPEEMRRAVASLEYRAAYLYELGILAMRVPPMLHVEMPPLAPVADDKGIKFLEQETKIRADLEKIGRSPKKARGLLEILSYRDSWNYLVAAARMLGLAPESVIPDGDLTALRSLITAMPVQRIFTELRIQTHLKRDWKGSHSDLLDFLAMATVVPFVDYYVADKETYNLAVDAGLNQGGSCRIVHRLTDLCDLLRDRLTL